MRSWSFVLAAALPVLLLPVSRAQPQSNVTSCQYGYSWTTNSLNQTACLVDAYLQGACLGGSFDTAGLSSRAGVYLPPSGSGVNRCSCSSVTYNMLAACSACQGNDWVTWLQWGQNCDPSSQVFIGYAFPIPPGTAVPNWAYLNPNDQGNAKFNVTAAQAAGNNPERTSDGSSGSSGGGGGKSNAGAIAGGVVGGIVGLALVALLAWWLLRRRNRHKADAMAPLNTGPTITSSHGYSMGYVNAPLYDPNDPSTHAFALGHVAPLPPQSPVAAQLSGGAGSNTGISQTHRTGGSNGAGPGPLSPSAATYSGIAEVHEHQSGDRV